MPLQILGVRELHYTFNRPIIARYLVCDVSLLSELNSRLDVDTRTEAGASAVVAASPDVLKEYERVIRFRDTRVYNPAYQRAIRKIQEGVRELMALRMLEGEDKYLIREDILKNISEGNTWTVER